VISEVGDAQQSRVYSDLAHLYDSVFGWTFAYRERKVIEQLAIRPGDRILEVGVGTGIALGAYPAYSNVIGLDASTDMLSQAKSRILTNGWNHIDLRPGDAQKLEFPDNSFDLVTSFHVITVVRDPRGAMDEMVRVCKPGGQIVFIGHFASTKPYLFLLGKLVNPITKLLGWTTMLHLRDIIDGQPISLQHNARTCVLSFQFLILARKLNDP
jgi:phosphatidylethanolamine/phosphatidyl-N-methylethanolamine N-methyltransferase